jgi:hypothetical protein
LNAGVDRERIILSKPAGWRWLRGIAAALAQRLDATLVKGDPDFAGIGDPRVDWLKRAWPRPAACHHESYWRPAQHPYTVSGPKLFSLDLLKGGSIIVYVASW